MSWYKIAQEIEDIPDNCKGGDCYQAAGRYVMDNALQGSNQNLILVHGIVSGQGEIAGVRYGHAWVENGEEVIDVAGGRELRVPKIIYYAIGNIDNTFRYTPEEMREKLIESETWGPWDLQSKF